MCVFVFHEYAFHDFHDTQLALSRCLKTIYSLESRVM